MIHAGALVRIRWAVLGAAAALALGGATIGIVDATASTGERAVFVPITPCRLFDTRAADPIGASATPLTAGETHTQPVRGNNGNCIVADDAVGVAMNVTVVNGTGASYLTIWPSDAERPLASSLNWTAGAPPIPNKVDIDIGTDGAIKLFNNAGTVDVLADVVGYYVDHNHDDRYYPRGESDARYYPRAESDARYYPRAESDGRYYNKTDADQRFAPSTQRINVSILGFRQINGATNPLYNVNGCLNAPDDGWARLPLDLPVGANLRTVDVTMLDDIGNSTYTLQLQRFVVEGQGNTYSVQAEETGGGLFSAVDKTVVEHLTPESPVVDEGTSYELVVLGIGGAANGVCAVVIEYDMTP